jgi:hypothetical protein
MDNLLETAVTVTQVEASMIGYPLLGTQNRLPVTCTGSMTIKIGTLQYASRYAAKQRLLYASVNESVGSKAEVDKGTDGPGVSDKKKNRQ